MTKDFFAGKKVLIMGLGRFEGGLDSAKFAAQAGAKVTVTDLAEPKQLTDSLNKLKDYPKIEYHLGSHDHKDFEQTDIIITNPAIPADNEYLEYARKNNKIITSQIEIFFQLCNATIVGITGSNGKSTTTALTAHLLKSQTKRNIWLSGNIGNHPLLTIVDKIAPDDIIVLELSSFQLEQLSRIKKAPHIALLTNLTPNHLDRHKTFENYCNAKENIFKHQPPNSVSIFNAQDKIATQWFDKYSKDTTRTCLKFSIADLPKAITETFTLPGRFNLSNLSAARTIANHLAITDEQIKKALPTFNPLPHRLQLIAEKNGTKWYNDSISTTPQST